MVVVGETVVLVVTDATAGSVLALVPGATSVADTGLVVDDAAVPVDDGAPVVVVVVVTWTQAMMPTVT